MVQAIDHDMVCPAWGSPTTYVTALDPVQRQLVGGTGPCAFLDRKGDVVPRELRRIESVIHRYEAAEARACALNRLTLAGDKKAAQVARRALRARGLVPAS